MKRSMSCMRKHPSELTGFVDLEVVYEDQKVLEATRIESAPICMVRLASEAQRKRLADAKSQSDESQKVDLLGKLEMLERAVDGQGSASISELSEVRRQIADAQNLPSLQPLMTNEMKQRISRAFNGLRLMALNARSAPGKP